MCSQDLLILFLVFHAVSSSVYYVRQENLSASDMILTLNNLLKFSDVHLRLFHGTYTINNRIMIRNVYNVSLTGSITNDLPSTIVQCHLLGGVIVINSSNINISGIAFENCQTSYSQNLNIEKHRHIDSKWFTPASVLVMNSHSVNIQHILVLRMHAYNIALINVFEKSTLNEIKAKGLIVLYGYSINTSIKSFTHNLMITNYHPLYNAFSLNYFYELAIYSINQFYSVNITISNVNFQIEKALYYFSVCSSGNDSFTITNCNFSSIKFLADDESKSVISLIVREAFCMDATTAKFIKIVKCYFVNNDNNDSDVLKNLIMLQGQFTISVKTADN